jgi:hypothetical protein
LLPVRAWLIGFIKNSVLGLCLYAKAVNRSRGLSAFRVAAEAATLIRDYS